MDSTDPPPSGPRDPERFYCPFHGCNRSFAELWRLKVHYRAPPDIRGSGKERGHGTELTHCPKCSKALKPGKHHVGCSGGKTAPRQASKRSRAGPDGESIDDEEPSPSKQHRPAEFGPGGPPQAWQDFANGQATQSIAAAPAANGPTVQSTDQQQQQQQHKPAEWPAVQPPPHGYYPPHHAGMPYWPDPAHMEGYAPPPGMPYPPPYPAGPYAHGHFYPPPHFYPGYPFAMTPHPGMPGMVPPPSSLAPPSGSLPSHSAGVMAPMPPGMMYPGMPHVPGYHAPMPHMAPHAAIQQQQVQGTSSLQQQQPQQQQQQQQPASNGAGPSSVATAEPAVNGNIFEEIDGFNMGRAPSPPPLPSDFHLNMGAPTTNMMFNFSQFSQKLPVHHNTISRLEKELNAAGMQLPDTNLQYDHTDDGDLMQLLFGVPDELPTMATIHLHKWSSNIPAEAADGGDLMPLHINGNVKLGSARNSSTNTAGAGVVSGLVTQPFSRQESTGTNKPLQGVEVKAEALLLKRENTRSPDILSHLEEDHHRDHLLDAETFRLLQSCE